MRVKQFRKTRTPMDAGGKPHGRAYDIRYISYFGSVKATRSPNVNQARHKTHYSHQLRLGMLKIWSYAKIFESNNSGAAKQASKAEASQRHASA